MADSMIRSWWERLRGRLRPSPCPFSQARLLEMPLRAWRAGPKRILRTFALRPGERVLEIGPGIGYYSIEATRMVGDGGSLVCLDIQSEMLEAVRRKAVDRAGCPVFLLRADALRLPLRSRSVDRVILITVLGELPDRRLGLAEIGRVLRPGGRLSVSEQFPDPDFVPLGALRRDLSAAGFVEESTRGLLVYASTWRREAEALEEPPRWYTDRRCEGTRRAGC